MRDLTVVGGIPVDRVTADEALSRISAMVINGRQTGRTHQITTVNVDFVINGIKDPTVLEILQVADLSIADGMPVVWGSKLRGTPLAERVTGADLVPMLAELSARRSYRVVLFGGEPGVAATAADILRTRSPGADLVPIAGPYSRDLADMDPEVLRQITEAKPDIVCVALGHPKQERWIQMYGTKVGAPVLIGVGGSLDFIAGTKSRAPRWVQDIGMEWMHRLVTEPRRLGKRYAACFRHFGPLLAAEVWRMRSSGRSSEAPSAVRTTEPGTGLRLTAVRSLDRIDVIAALEGRSVTCFSKVTVDVSSLERLDQQTVSSLVALAYECRTNDVEFEILTNERLDRSVLPALRLDQHLPTGIVVPPSTITAGDGLADLAETA
ncbi:MAG: WecB/TagA/CpsF family glycosyltransferase [Acidimicrobiia bacterium]